MKRKRILASVCGIAACMGLAVTVNAAENKLSYHLDEMIIEEEALESGFVSSKDRMGILGSIDAIDVPFTQRNYTEKTIADFYDPNQPLNGTLANNPSIRIGSPTPMYTDFNLRGINMNASHYYINGIPNLFNQTRSIPAHILQSVEIVSGPSTVLNGTTFSNNGTNGTDAPVGMLNGITKRASRESLTRYTQRFSGRSHFAETIDLGRRFGKNDQWGVRLNLHNENGGLSINKTDVRDKNIYLNIDHNNSKSSTNLFGGYFDWSVKGGQRWLYTTGVTELIKAPENSNNLSFAEQKKENHGYLMTLNHTRYFSDRWKGFINAGTSCYNEEKYDPNTGSLMLADDGSLTGKFRNYKSKSKGLYWQLGVTNESKMNELKNTLSFTVDGYKYKSKSVNSGSKKGQALLEGDLWQGTHINGVPILAGDLAGVNYSREGGAALTLADRAELGKAAVVTALQYRNTETKSSVGHKVSKTSLNPSFAFAYKPVENLSFYVSHAQSYTKPVEVGKSYDNAGEIFKPIKNKQNEMGMKYENKGILHSLALFDLNQASYIVEDSDGPLGKKYTQQGQNRYKGVEYSLAGKISEKWHAMGGLMYLHGRKERLASVYKHLEGTATNGAPKWNAVLAADYSADDKNSFVVRCNYVTEAPINNEGVRTPAYFTFDLGYKYKTSLGSVPATFNVMCYNLFDRNYWIARGSSVALCAPRTFMFSAQFDI